MRLLVQGSAGHWRWPLRCGAVRVGGYRAILAGGAGHHRRGHNWPDGQLRGARASALTVDHGLNKAYRNTIFTNKGLHDAGRPSHRSRSKYPSRPPRAAAGRAAQAAPPHAPRIGRGGRPRGDRVRGRAAGRRLLRLRLRGRAARGYPRCRLRHARPGSRRLDRTPSASAGSAAPGGPSADASKPGGAGGGPAAGKTPSPARAPSRPPPARGSRRARGPPAKWRIEVEEGSGVDANTAAQSVEKILGDPRGWIKDPAYGFQLVGAASRWTSP